MRILYITPKFPPHRFYPVVPYAYDWASVLSRIGDVMVVGGSTFSGSRDFGDFEGIFYNMGNDRGIRHVLNWFRVLNLSGRSFRDVDIIVAHGSLFAGSVATFLGKPFVIVEHAFLEGWRRKIAGWIWSRARLRIAVSESLSDYLGSDFRVVPNPIPDIRIEVKKFDAPTILFAGTRRAKGWRLFEEIVEIAREKELPYRFIMVGREDFPSPNVISMSKLNRLSFLEMLARSHVFLNLSRAESFAVAVAESLMVGTPVLTTSRNLLKIYSTGVFVSPPNPEDVLKGVGRLLNMDHDAEAMRRFVVENFSYGVVEEKLRSLLLESGLLQL